MALTDYSQSGEQSLILEWADRRATKGRFLDIGSTDGIAASNVRALALRGWSGVCIEPAAWAFDKLADLYADVPEIETVQAAIVAEPSPLVRFHYAHDLLSTTEDDYRDKWEAAGVPFTPIYVAAITVEQLLAVCPGPYDLISIDVEGGTLPLWDELRRLDAFAPNAMAVVEAENGTERWEVQHLPAHEGWARVGVTPNNVVLEAI